MMPLVVVLIIFGIGVIVHIFCCKNNNENNENK